MDKCAWTLTRPAGVDAETFQEELLTELPKRILERVPSTTAIWVTIQEPTAYSGALVPVGGSEQPVDALLEVRTAEQYVPLDELHDLLRSRCRHVQGWRVHPTVIFDSTPPRQLGEPSPMTGVIFVERLDGTTPEHFSRNWYIHAGHLDGQDEPSPESIAERKREEGLMPDARYIQNRVLEPITPTAWVMHGFTQLMLGMAVPPLEGTLPYERTRGEDAFDRWPPRMLQGYEYRLHPD